MRLWTREEKLQAKEAARSGALEQGGGWGAGGKGDDIEMKGDQCGVSGVRACVRA